MTLTHRRRERGHTLVEVAMASGVFMIGVLGLVPLFYRGTAGTTVGTRVTQATALAQSRLGLLESLPFTAPALVAGTYQDGDTNLRPDGTPDTVARGTHNATFWRTYVVMDVDYNPNISGNDYKRITVTVSWWDGTNLQNPEQSVTVSGGKAVTQ